MSTLSTDVSRCLHWERKGRNVQSARPTPVICFCTLQPFLYSQLRQTEGVMLVSPAFLRVLVFLPAFAGCVLLPDLLFHFYMAKGLLRKVFWYGQSSVYTGSCWDKNACLFMCFALDCYVHYLRDEFSYLDEGWKRVLLSRIVCHLSCRIMEFQLMRLGCSGFSGFFVNLIKDQ